MVTEEIPMNSVSLELGPPAVDFAGGGHLLVIGLKGKQANIDSCLAQLAQIWEYLGLHKRLAQTKVAQVECANTHAPAPLRCLALVIRQKLQHRAQYTCIYQGPKARKNMTAPPQR